MKKLKFILTGPFAALVIVGFCIFAYIAYNGAKDSVEILVTKLAKNSSDNIKSHLDLLLDEAQDAAQINALSTASGQLTLKYIFEKPEVVFLTQHKKFHNIDDTYFGRYDGAIVGVDKETDKYLLKITTNFPNRDFIELDENGSRGSVVKTNTYDATSRDWFKLAKEKNSSVWSNVYIFKNKGKLGLTAASPAFDTNKAFLGVFGVHLTLDSLSEFLNSVKVGEHTVTYIVEQNGEIIASSASTNIAKPDDLNKSKLIRITAAESNNSVIAGSYDKILNNYHTLLNAVDKPFKAEIGNTNYIIQTTIYKDKYGIFWYIINATDEMDFMGGVYTLALQSIALALGLLFVILAIGSILANKIASPLIELSKSSKDVANGSFGTTSYIKGTGEEISALIDSFNSMSLQLKDYFTNLNELNADLEYKVKERTIELESAHRNIQDSIKYASLIQHNILPRDEIFKMAFEDYFIVWEPRDTVGGDIYLMEKLEDKNEFILIVVDCTGHGIPGAFVTMLVKAVERQIFGHIKNGSLKPSPALILKSFNQIIKAILKQDSVDTKTDAGFDGAVLLYNKDEQYIKYASAKTTMFCFIQ